MQKEESKTSSFKKPSGPVNTKKPITRSHSTKKKEETLHNGLKNVTSKISEIDEKAVEDLENIFKEKISLKCLAEKYFFLHSDKSKVVSSKKTLASLGCNRLNADQAAKLLSKLPSIRCLNEIQERVKNMELMIFPKMIVQLKKNYNVLLHGFGSKLELLESFVRKYLCEENCLVVPGFQSNISMIQILNKIIETYSIDIQVSSRSPSILSSAIRDHFDTNGEDELYLVIHNIDGPATIDNLDAIVTLAQSRYIHVIASVDHIYSDRLWAQNDPNWIWHDCTTCLPYSVEACAGNSRLMSENSTAGLDSLRAVTASLHDNAKKVFLLLAKYQIENKGPKYDGMPVEILLRQSRDLFFVTNEMSLMNLLTEFKDHKLIIFKFVGVCA